MKIKKLVAFFSIGTLFGIVLSKAEVISWYRIIEMFYFESFHMFGIIGSAVILGIISVGIIRLKKWKNVYGTPLKFKEKKKSIIRYLVGGIIFGLGWVLTGTCPGPMYILLGYGYSIFIVVILSALLGTFVYGLIKDKLPH